MGHMVKVKNITGVVVVLIDVNTAVRSITSQVKTSEYRGRTQIANLELLLYRYDDILYVEWPPENCS